MATEASNGGKSQKLQLDTKLDYWNVDWCIIAKMQIEALNVERVEEV